MQLVCCPLPETEIAGQRVGLAISLDVAWLLLQQFSSSADIARATAPQCKSPGTTDKSAVNAAELLILSPSLLFWSIAQLELQVPLYHPDQLIDKFRQLVDLRAFVGNVELTPPSSRMEIRKARFVARLKALGWCSAVAAGTDCKLNQAFGALCSDLTGIEPARIGTWIEKKQIKGSFWSALSDACRRSSPVTLSINEFFRKVDPHDDSRRLQSEKMASLKRLAYGASHEINNPLANIASRAQTLLRDETDAERRKTLAKINQQAFRAFEMIADMMLFAHPPQLVIAETDLKPILQSVVDELKICAAEQESEIELQCVEPFFFQVDAVQISVAVRAVIQNGLESLQSGGNISVFAKPEEAGEFLEIIVTDNGPGFRESEMTQVFDPFFSGREAGRGLGFGLSKAWRIVEQHGGEIVLANLPHAGARVQIRIPYRVPARGRTSEADP